MLLRPSEGGRVVIADTFSEMVLVIPEVQVVTSDVMESYWPPVRHIHPSVYELHPIKVKTSLVSSRKIHVSTLNFYQIAQKAFCI